MKSLFFTCVAVAVFVLACQPAAKKSEPANEQPTAVSKNNSSFDPGLDLALSGYYQLAEAFVQWDSSAIYSLSKNTATKMSSIDWSTLQFANDSVQKNVNQFLFGTIKGLRDIEKAKSMEEGRRRLSSISENLAHLLHVIKYDNQKLFLQECPMAFNDEETATWISAAPEIRNPYLGLHHPRYKSGMLHCGTTKEEINYTGTK